DSEKKAVLGRPAEGPGAGLVTLPGEPITPGFTNGPALLPHISPPLAHFARRSGWEHRHFWSWSRHCRRHFVSVEKEASVAAGSGRRSPVRRRRFIPEVPPVSSPNPPPRSACGEAGAARELGRGRGVGREAGCRERLQLQLRRTSEGGRGAMSEQTPAEAGTAGAREDACRDYQSSLEDLTFNSKPHINMLTILAEENLPFAKEIVSLIEAQTAKKWSSATLCFPVVLLFCGFMWERYVI
uniref:PCF11 cleavage and polyadenylation factor subunit n=1 Tax=Equus asinus TaxID=9793 RepID=A0A9L0IBP9_EQUAS